MTSVRVAIIQAKANLPKEEAVEKHVGLIAKAAAEGAQITCLQEIFHGPYFCAEQDPKWYATAEPEDGPTVTRMRELARQHHMALVVPWFEEAQTGVYYNSAAVIENDGTRARLRQASRRSRARSRSQTPRIWSRVASRTCSTPPNFRRAARSAAAGVIPARTFRAVCCSMWKAISSARRRSWRGMMATSYASVARSTSSIARDSRRHESSSRVTCRRPAAVSL